MFICFKCHKAFKEPKELITHFKVDHLMTTKLLILQCGQSNCRQTFTNFSSFRVHLEKRHMRQISNVELDKTLNILLTTPKQLNESELNESPPVIDNIPVGKNKPNMKDISTVFKNLKQQALFISLNLYEKNSMPRSHVIEIQKMFSILSSALSSAIEYQLNQDDILINSNLECLLNFCKSPFEEIRTEHRMIGTLEELSLLRNQRLTLLKIKFQK